MTYRKLENPKMRVQDVLVTLANEFQGTFCSADVADRCNINMNDAMQRLNRLKMYGTIKRVKATDDKDTGKAGVGRPFVMFIVTDWGRKIADKYKREGFGL